MKKLLASLALGLTLGLGFLGTASVATAQTAPAAVTAPAAKAADAAAPATAPAASAASAPTPAPAPAPVAAGPDDDMGFIWPASGQVFMASLVSKVLSAKTLSDPGKLSQLTSAVQRSVVIDDDWDIIEFAKQLQNLAGGKVQFETIPVLDINGMTDYGESIVKVDPKAVKKYIAGLVGADSEDSEETSEAPTTVNASSIT